MMLAPEHGLVTTFAKESEDEKAFLAKAQRFRAQDRAGRMTGEVAKEGFFTGRFAINPFTNLPVPIWVANYVLGEYGTGAVMARGRARRARFRLRDEIRPADRPGDPSRRKAKRRPRARSTRPRRTTAFCSTRAASTACRPTRRGRRITEEAEERGIGHGTVQFRLKDWGISRQRYWGTPDPDDPLPGRRHRAGAGRAAAGGAAEGHRVHRPRRFAAGQRARVRERDVSEVRRAGSTRDRHDGHVRRFVVVLLPLLPTRTTISCRSIRRRSRTGRRSISTAAASSTRFCT